jgi:hypothetical protein
MEAPNVQGPSNVLVDRLINKVTFFFATAAIAALEKLDV